MAPTKPVVLIVPGAWHPASLYEPMQTALTQANFDVTVASLPSLNAKDPFTADCKIDADAVRNQLLSQVDEAGHDVVLLAHSYGGIPAGGAARGLGKTTRAKDGKKGGVVGMVYMCAFVVPEGQTMIEFLGGQHPPFLLDGQPSPGLCSVSDPKNVFYNDVPDSISTSLVSSLQPHAIRAFESPTPPPAWAEADFAGRLGFLRCALDQALPTFVQDMFVEKSGVKWAVRDMNCDHSPWANRPAEVVQVLQGFLEGFAA